MKRKALKAAFPHTIPVMTGYLFLGMSYGVLVTASGFPFWMPTLTSLTIFAGSMEFVLVNLLLSGFDLLQAFLMTLMINARHLFYGLSMLEKYRERLTNPLITQRLDVLDIFEMELRHIEGQDYWRISCESMIGSATWILIPPVTSMITPKPHECMRFLELFELIGDAVVNNR